MKSRYSLLIACASMIMVLTVFVANGSAMFGLFGQYSKVKGDGGNVLIPVKDVDDGAAHYYRFMDGPKEIRFFVIKSRDGVIRAAFDACDVCYPARKGYSQQGDFMICNNCGRKFHTSRINVEKGGCNPAPLNRKIDKQNLVIREADIVPGGRFF